MSRTRRLRPLFKGLPIISRAQRKRKALKRLKNSPKDGSKRKLCRNVRSIKYSEGNPLKQVQETEDVIITEDQLWSMYKNQGILGEGAYGQVLAASRGDDDLPVAVKVIPKHTEPRLIEMNGYNVPSEAYFINELSDHPFIINLLNYYETDKDYILILERPMRSLDLLDFLLTQDDLLNESEVREIFVQLLHTVEFCQSRGIVHNDIKEENIVMDLKTGIIKVIDFGLADELTEKPVKRFTGTLECAPPEWFSKKEYNSTEATVWSLGLVLFSMVTEGQLFNDVNSIREFTTIPMLQGVSEELQDLLKRLLNKDPKERPTLEEIKHDRWLAGML